MEVSPTDDRPFQPKADLPAAQSEFQREAASREIGLVREFWDFLRFNKKWWLTPIVVLLLLLTALAFVAGSSAAPFIYTLF
jgi:hypothetical protein